MTTPAEHWIHLRTTNPIESTFATVRLRTRVTKGPGSRAAGVAMAFKLIESAQTRWRAVNAPHLVALVRAGATFINGKLERPTDHDQQGGDRKSGVKHAQSTGLDYSSRQEQESASPVHCPYCGYRADLWAFAPEQLAVVEAAAEAVAEQHFAAEVNDMLRRTFGGRPHASSSHSGFGIDISYRSDPPPPRRSLPTFEVEETRRTMECERCQERFAVYGLAIYCPSCGQLAPAQQFGELLRIQQERLAALDAIPTEPKRQLAESGVLTANYESTIKDGFTALETYLKSRFIADAPTVSLVGKGAVFQRLDEAAGLYTAHLAVDLRDLVGQKAWRDLLRIAAMRHVLTHNGGVVDVKFLEQVPDWPQAMGQRLHVSEKDASEFLLILRELASVLRPD